LLQTSIGLGLGLTAAFFAARALRTQLYGIDKPDPMVLVAAVLALLASAAAAGVVPARRAARVNPASALRAK
jgi:ABC-type antimicrobial peptide transport system permease subunit